MAGTQERPWSFLPCSVLPGVLPATDGDALSARVRKGSTSPPLSVRPSAGCAALYSSQSKTSVTLFRLSSRCTVAESGNPRDSAGKLGRGGNTARSKAASSHSPNGWSLAVTRTRKRRSPTTTPPGMWSRFTGPTSGWASRRATNCAWKASSRKPARSISSETTEIRSLRRRTSSPREPAGRKSTEA